jgi:hypothetical protein
LFIVGSFVLAYPTVLVKSGLNTKVIKECRLVKDCFLFLKVYYKQVLTYSIDRDFSGGNGKTFF